MHQAIRTAVYIFAIILLVPSGVAASAPDCCYMGRGGPVEEGWPAHAMLVYGTYMDIGIGGLSRTNGIISGGVARTDDGDWLARDFMPYVAHMDPYGMPDDTLFDTFVFLALKSPRDRHFGGELDQEKAALYEDWEWYINRIFTPRKHLAALEATVARVGDLLELTDYQVNVYIMIPYPSYLVTDFGTPGVDDDSLLPVENRLRAIRWYVDTVVERWQAFNPAHLRLAGFYWMQEHVNPEVPDEIHMVREAARYVHDHELKLGWIPWSGAYMATQWHSFDFDWAVTQPNHMFRDEPGLIDRAIQRMKTAHMGMEIEVDATVSSLSGVGGREKFLDYLDAGARHGVNTHGVVAYYQVVNTLGHFYSRGGLDREIYELVYQFIKGTYVPRDGDYGAR